MTLRTERDNSSGGILIPDIAMEVLDEATVVAVGPGARDKSGTRMPIEVRAGERVLVSRHAGARVILADEAYTKVRPDDILGIRTPEPLR